MKLLLSLAIAVGIIAFSSTDTHAETPLQPAPGSCDYLNNEMGMSDYQVYIMYKSYMWGLPFDMGYSMAAIAFAESSAGLYLDNPNDPSAGVHHILVWHVMDDLGIERTNENIEITMEMLASNFSLSAHYAIEVLSYWYNEHNGNWYNTWRSYNRGYYNRNESARTASIRYANKINYLVKTIQRNCNW
jgi:hypothetical protein